MCVHTYAYISLYVYIYIYIRRIQYRAGLRPAEDVEDLDAPRRGGAVRERPLQRARRGCSARPLMCISVARRRGGSYQKVT